MIKRNDSSFVTSMPRGSAYALLLAGLLALGCTQAADNSGNQLNNDVEPGTPVAFRISEMNLKDPHIFFNFSGCRDITDTPVFGISVNSILSQMLQRDTYSLNEVLSGGQGGGALPQENPDGLLDLSIMLYFDSLDPSAQTGSLDFMVGDCTAPLDSTSCTPAAAAPIALRSAVTNSASGACAEVGAGTDSGYPGGIETPAGPCFTADLPTIPLDLGAIRLTFEEAKLAASYAGDGLVQGLITAFVSEASATDAVVDTPIGTISMSSVLPGGTGSCATGDDRDTNADGVPGWYFYINFEAEAVPFSE